MTGWGAAICGVRAASLRRGSQDAACCCPEWRQPHHADVDHRQVQAGGPATIMRLNERKHMGIDVQSIYKPFQRYFRPRRMRNFVQYFNVTNNTSILDAGGTPLNWSFIPQRPQVTMINIFGQES